MPRITVGDKSQPIAICNGWHRVSIQVRSVGPTLYYAPTQAEVETPDVDGTPSGFEQVSADGKQNFWWFGDVWARASAPCSIMVISMRGQYGAPTTGK